MVMNQKISTIDLIYIAFGAALITVCSWISIPTVVPFTLQTFAVFCVLSILGGKRGTLSVLVYILLGAVGLPVFSGFKSGAAVLLGTTGGYILGFILTGIIYIITEKTAGKKQPFETISLVLGLIACYTFGTIWFMNVYAAKTGPIGIGAALSWCVLPFIIPDIIKLILALLISVRVRNTALIPNIQ
ncbi:MAG: biotin transporter BioY [Lachnospiraceae bacterium]|nr:biotin transporter BioY [Lachnospiraceae bacterium]